MDVIDIALTFENRSVVLRVNGLAMAAALSRLAVLGRLSSISSFSVSSGNPFIG